MKSSLSKLNLENYQELLKVPENVELLEATFQYTELVNSFGYQMQAFSPSSLRDLANLENQKKLTIANTFRSLFAEAAPFLNRESANILLLEKTLKNHRLLQNKEMFDSFDNQSLIEIYSGDMRQIFRSMNFYEYTNYSMLDLFSYEWWVLWQKPSLIVKTLTEYAEKVIREKLPITQVDIKPFLNIESLNTGATEPFIPRSVLVSDFNIGYLEKEYFSRDEFFMCTTKAKIVSTGTSALKTKII